MNEGTNGKVKNEENGLSATEHSPGNAADLQEDNDSARLQNVAIGGARPKVKNYLCGIPNGISTHYSSGTSAKLSNNVSTRKLSCGPECQSVCSSENSASVNLQCAIDVAGESEECGEAIERNCVDSLASRDEQDLSSSSSRYPVSDCNGVDNAEGGKSSLSPHQNDSDKSDSVNCDSFAYDQHDEDSSSDTGNDGDDGLSDEYCIYTYKGDQAADLPSSFFKLDILNNDMLYSDFPNVGANDSVRLPGVPQPEVHGARERASSESNGPSSPEMDYLEMDFDPGPSCERDFGTDSEQEVDGKELGEQYSERTCASNSYNCNCLGCQSAECASKSSEGDKLCSKASGASTAGAAGDSGDKKHETENKQQNNLDCFQLPSTSMSSYPFREQQASGSSATCRSDGEDEPSPGTSHEDGNINIGSVSVPDLSPESETGFPSRTSLVQSHSVHSNISDLKAPNVCLRTWPVRDTWGHHSVNGDLWPPGESDTEFSNIELLNESLGLCATNGNYKTHAEGFNSRKYNLQSALYHCIMAKRLVLEKQASLADDESNMQGDCQHESDIGRKPVERTMIWSEQEACVKQVTQISTSACGATAVLNALLALNIPVSVDKVREGVKTRLRAETAPLPQYLFSRSVAGAMHSDLIRGVECASDGELYARFFHMFPERMFSLTKWLSFWMRKGAVPIATLNLQKGVGPGSTVPDAWHHQMIFGVGPRGIYLTNPLECVPEAALMLQLCSPSVLMIRRRDVVSRWNDRCDLRPLMKHPDPRWKIMNVLGQVVNILHEDAAPNIPGYQRVLTEHITIPAAYQSGITLIVVKESPAFEDLLQASELPLVQDMKTMLV